MTADAATAVHLRQCFTSLLSAPPGRFPGRTLDVAPLDLAGWAVPEVLRPDRNAQRITKAGPAGWGAAGAFPGPLVTESAEE
jgi:hypothetical protein